MVVRAFAGIVLCGGQSTRMGQPKADLPFGPETMLQRVVRILSTVVSPVVVVAAPEQVLPPLCAEVLVARDARPGRGPLEGLAAGLAALRSRAEAAFVTSCDAPLIQPAFVRRMTELLEEFDVAVPKDGEFFHPLAAVYRTNLLPRVETLLAADRLRPVFLYEACATREVSVDELRTADPELLSLRNLNTPRDYAAALRDAGYGNGR